MKTSKKALNERINESSASEMQPARPPENAVPDAVPCSQWAPATPLPLAWGTPYVPVALGPKYHVAEAVPMQGSM